MRTLIPVQAEMNSGKSGSIKLVYERYERELAKNDVIVPNTLPKEVFGILKINGVNVGFVSVGDKPGRLEDDLEEIREECDVDVIVCGCRKGARFKGSEMQEVLKKMEAAPNLFTLDPITKIPLPKDKKTRTPDEDKKRKALELADNKVWAGEIRTRIESAIARAKEGHS